MPRTLAPRTNLDALRKGAKRWRKAIEAGDADATARYAAAVRDPRPAPKLREVQHALAGEYGFASWAALKQEIEDRARSHAERGGLDGWTPLLRLAYTRLPTQAAESNAVEIAGLLLDQGADPRTQWSDGQNAFKVLTGVIGGGEGGQSAHPQAETLARLLIARGADPLDG